MAPPKYSGPRVNVVLKEDVYKAVCHYIVDLGLGERSKSKVIQDALEAFPPLKPYLEKEGALPAQA